MSNLKDTDIDDLFRRASDKYPLRTDSADWDRMAAALENKGSEPPVDGVDTEEKRKKRRFFWLFLLLPLFGAGYYAWHHTGGADAANAGPAGAAVVSGGAAAGAGGGGAAADGAGANGGAAAADGAGANGGVGVSGGDVVSGGGTAAKGRGVIVSGRQKSGGNAAGGGSVGGGTDGGTRMGRGTDGEENGADKFGDANGKFGNGATGGGASGGLGSRGGVENNDRLFYDLQRVPIPRDYRLVVNVTAPEVKKDSVVKPKARIKHFYAGVFGSPDLSTVKMQSVNGVGTTFGVILGYTFNGGRWAIETGAYVDRKKYYTEGDDFSTKEVRLPYNSWLTDVNGICYMWEIPLNVRYNFNPGAKTSWFATAGLSTYLMSHEKYTYGLEWPGSTSPYDSTWNFHHASQYPFSIINLSAGFEQRLGKIGNLRVEPYVRLPLTGLGTGKLPIMSAGVNIGITRQLW